MQLSFNNILYGRYFAGSTAHTTGFRQRPFKLLEPSIHWNSRYESFGIGAIIVIAALSALYLKKRLYGSIAYTDLSGLPYSSAI
jgi:hypothetical protein